MLLYREEALDPHIDGTSFGSITIGGTRYDHDVLIRRSGAIKKRKKKLSKAIYGTSHVLSLDEAQHVYEEGAKRLIVGAGQYGRLGLSDEAREYFSQRGLLIELSPTGQAIRGWNEAEGDTLALFHVTC